MRKIALIAVAVFVALVVGACIVVALQPAEFGIQRSIRIATPPAKVFPLVNDLEAWDAWSPWSKLDPNAVTTLSEPAVGKGATIAWNGNDQIGEGSMIIVESRPDELVELEQSFVRPMEGKARFYYEFNPRGAETQVTMRMAGTNGFLGKAMCLVMDMDAMLGPNFDQALVNLKAQAEKAETQPDEPPNSALPNSAPMAL